MLYQLSYASEAERTWDGAEPRVGSVAVAVKTRAPGLSREMRGGSRYTLPGPPRDAISGVGAAAARPHAKRQPLQADLSPLLAASSREIRR